MKTYRTTLVTLATRYPDGTVASHHSLLPFAGALTRARNRTRQSPQHYAGRQWIESDNHSAVLCLASSGPRRRTP